MNKRPRGVSGGKQSTLNFDPMQWSQGTSMGIAACSKTKKKGDITWEKSIQEKIFACLIEMR